MIGFIYFLKNPVTHEIFYIGATKTSLSNRLRTHYQHLAEYKKGQRKSNKRYLYLDKMSQKAEIHLLEIVENISLLDTIEIMYIGLFKSWGFTLTNQTQGGKGGDTYKSITDVRKQHYKLLMQAKLKGIQKPKGFGANLSKTRQGIGNPAAGTSIYFPVACYKDGKLKKVFNYPFEINEFLSKGRGAYSNILKVLSGKIKYKPYGYEWIQHKI